MTRKGSRRFELVSGGSSKFWEIEASGTSYTVRWGRIGSDGQAKKKSCPTKDAVIRETEALVREKLGKGYKETSRANGPKPAIPNERRSAETVRDSKAGAGTAGKAAGKAAIARLTKLLERHRPTFVALLRPAAARDAQARFRKAMGKTPVPEELLALHAWRDGRREEVVDALDPNSSLFGDFDFLSLAEIQKAWKDWSTLAKFDKLADRFASDELWNKGWVPIFGRYDKELLCVDTAGMFGGQPGQLVLWNRKTIDRIVVCSSLAVLANWIADALAKRKLTDQAPLYGTELTKIEKGYPIHAKPRAMKR